MRKRINTVTIIIYIVFLIGAIGFGWYDVKTIGAPLRGWPISLGCLVAMLLTGIIRSCLLLKDKKNTIEANAVRVVSVKPTRVEGEAIFNISATAELPLIHVDNVDSKLVLVKIYKNKSLLTDSVGKVVGQ